MTAREPKLSAPVSPKVHIPTLRLPERARLTSPPAHTHTMTPGDVPLIGPLEGSSSSLPGVRAAPEPERPLAAEAGCPKTEFGAGGWWSGPADATAHQGSSGAIAAENPGEGHHPLSPGRASSLPPPEGQGSRELAPLTNFREGGSADCDMSLLCTSWGGESGSISISSDEGAIQERLKLSLQIYDSGSREVVSAVGVQSGRQASRGPAVVHTSARPLCSPPPPAASSSRGTGVSSLAWRAQLPRWMTQCGPGERRAGGNAAGSRSTSARQRMISPPAGPSWMDIARR